MQILSSGLLIFAVWPLIVLFLYGWAFFFVYSPAEVTELQRVPLILQGGTDWGNSNLFAAYVTGHFIFGVLGCLVLVQAHLNNKSRELWLNVLGSFFIAFALINAPAVFNLFELYLWGRHTRAYFLCEQIQVIVIFSVTYLLSVLWIRALKKWSPSVWLTYALSPFLLAVLAIMGQGGITPKAGQIKNAGEIPNYRPNSSMHAWFLTIHRGCSSCLR